VKQRESVSVLRLFGGQVFGDWFGRIKSHRILLRAIAQSEVSHHTDEIGSTHEKVR
jgi:DNA-binding HxlR family transcriptional regulator